MRSIVSHVHLLDRWRPNSYKRHERMRMTVRFPQQFRHRAEDGSFSVA